MKLAIRHIALTFAAAGSLLLAGAAKMADVFCFTSVHDNGRGGMRVMWREHPDSAWTPLNGGRGVVRSDFGSLKSMYTPRVIFKDGEWKAIWNLDKEKTAVALTTSSDMVVWNPQRFISSTRVEPQSIEEFSGCTESKEVIGKDTIEGFLTQVPVSAITEYGEKAAAAGKRHIGRGERVVHDPETYKDLKSINARISVDMNHPKSVSDMLVGVFFEDINYSADGGLYAELIQNRDFEYSPADGNKDPEWNSMYAWSVTGDNASWNVAEKNPIHANNCHYLHVASANGGASVRNCGYDGICLTKSEPYDFSMFCRNCGNRTAQIEVRLLHNNGKVLAKNRCNVKPGDWSKLESCLKCAESCDSAMLELVVPAHAVIDLDMVSLFPRHTFKNRKNGLRADLAQIIADIHPRFVRFPGGCLVHGDGLDNIYNWKETVGPLEARRQAANIWRYHQSRGLGYYEYFQFCEDIGAEPLPVVAAGVSCQNSGVAGPSHHSHDFVTSYGQMGGIPMSEMDAYVQDVLDLIEWANGDASTKWGAVRAAAGHPKPFGLKYLGVGNEDLISDIFEERFKMIYDAVREKYPEIIVVGTTGPFVEGSDYEAGWRLAKRMNIPMVDEHNYNSPGWYINNGDFYDNYQRGATSVYLGEYAVHHPKRISTIETALATALFLSNVERNSDIVRMTSYAPLLARHGHTQWNPDLIYFDGSKVYPTVDYEVQRLFGCNSGDTYLPTAVDIKCDCKDVEKRIGVSTIKNSKTGETFVKIVNLLPVEMSADIDFGIAGKKISKTVLAGSPEDMEGKITETVCKPNDLAHATFEPYSLTIYKIQ